MKIHLLKKLIDINKYYVIKDPDGNESRVTMYMVRFINKSNHSSNLYIKEGTKYNFIEAHRIVKELDNIMWRVVNIKEYEDNIK